MTLLNDNHSIVQSLQNLNADRFTQVLRFTNGLIRLQQIELHRYEQHVKREQAMKEIRRALQDGCLDGSF